MKRETEGTPRGGKNVCDEKGIRSTLDMISRWGPIMKKEFSMESREKLEIGVARTPDDHGRPTRGKKNWGIITGIIRTGRWRGLQWAKK